MVPPRKFRSSYADTKRKEVTNMISFTLNMLPSAVALMYFMPLTNAAFSLYLDEAEVGKLLGERT